MNLELNTVEAAVLQTLLENSREDFYTWDSQKDEDRRYIKQAIFFLRGKLALVDDLENAVFEAKYSHHEY